MQKIILFSNPTEAIVSAIVPHLFPSDMEGMKVAYMPSDGANTKEKYTEKWRGIVEDNGCEFIYINNSLEGHSAESEVEKMMKCTVLIITGGNTFTLLRNIRRNKMDEAITEFSRREPSIICGFSAGALILTPTIAISNEGKDCDHNEVGIKDLKGLGLVDFELYPHYRDEVCDVIDAYVKRTGAEVRRLTDDEYIVLERVGGGIEEGPTYSEQTLSVRSSD